MDNIKDFVAGLDLLKQVEADIPDLAGTFNGRYTREVACPKCGGTTRLRLRVGLDGVQRVFCNNCEPRGMDAIAYIQWRDGIDFKAAKSFWVDRAGVYTASAPMVKPAPKVEQAPNATWQAKARAFVDSCAAYLWSGTPDAQRALAYLRAERMLTDETIKRAGLGYNPKPRKAAAADWGLDEDKYSKGVNASQGITIPRVILGEMWTVNIRRFINGAPYAGADKYLCVTGSSLGLAGADGIERDGVVLAFGGEFDRILAEQHAPAGVACVTFGGEGRNVSELWRNMLNRARAVHVCMDNDQAGNDGAFKWVTLPRSRRARVPLGKDLTEFAAQGGDVGAWITSTTGVYRWQAPTDAEACAAEAARWLAVYDDDTQSDDDRARALARLNVCHGKVLASDGTPWLSLAQ